MDRVFLTKYSTAQKGWGCGLSNFWGTKLIRGPSRNKPSKHNSYVTSTEKTPHTWLPPPTIANSHHCPPRFRHAETTVKGTGMGYQNRDGNRHGRGVFISLACPSYSLVRCPPTQPISDILRRPWVHSTCVHTIGTVFRHTKNGIRECLNSR